ncbi:MAG: glycosyltransferase family 2 protein [Armatimonadetes bacterium]|nr:glycosyltransferase family 2 protein [Armatimonadota bacterium]
MNPLVSTVIPTRNRAALLGGAVRSALMQTDTSGKPISQEIIITDDSSTDNTPEIGRAFEREYPGVVRYMNVRTGSPGGTRNIGADAATAPFLAFLDDDDEWLAGRLQRALDAFASHPGTAFIYGQTVPTNGDFEPAPESAPVFPPLPLVEGHPVAAFLRSPPHINTVLFRRELFLAHNGFDRTLSGFEDVDLLVRIVRRHECFAVSEPLARMRFHTDSLNGADKMWARFVDEQRSRRTHLRERDAFRPSFKERVLLSFGYRGWYVHRFLTIAAAANKVGNALVAAKATHYALRVSPLHALKNPLFWQVRRSAKNAKNTKEQTV